MDLNLIQKQVQDNSEELRSFLSDLKSWEKEMKRKDKELSENASDNEAIPPVRSKIKRTKQIIENDSSTNNTSTSNVKRISSYDYSAWDKFDVEKACEEVDGKIGTDEEEEEVEVAPAPSKNKADSESESDIAKLQEQALFEKELGNEHVKNQRWAEAIACYSKAIECNPFDAIFYANRALCYLKTKKARFAEMDCSSALRLDSSYVKAYQRRALARVELGQKDDARADFKKVLELEPNNAAAKSELAKLDKAPPEKLKLGKKDQKVSQKAKDTKTKSVVSKQEKSPLPKGDVVQSGQVLQESSGSLPGAGGDAESMIVKSADKGSADAKKIPWDEVGEKVTPIQKPPHLRSKKPLREILVEEVESLDKLPPLSFANKKKHEVKLIEEISSTHLELQTQDREIRNSLSEAPLTERKAPAKVHKRTEDLHVPHKEAGPDSSQSIPSVPTSSVQFFSSWKSVRNDSAQRFQYLKQVPGAHLPQLFLESLESKEFGEILSCLASDFTEKQEAVYPYLLGLSQVKRFSALVMFMSKAEKTVAGKLISYCEEKGECSKEELNHLKKCYELN